MNRPRGRRYGNYRYRIGCLTANAVVTDAVVTAERIKELAALLERQHVDMPRRILMLDMMPVKFRCPNQWKC